MSKSKKHHYVPESILKNFCFNGTSTYYIRRDSSRKSIEPRNIDSIFCRRHLNSFERDDGSKNDLVERFFAYELDNHVPGWFEIFLTARRTGNLDFGSEGMRNLFVQFFYYHKKRNPDFVEPIVSEVAEQIFGQDAVQEFESRHRKLTIEERIQFQTPDFRQRCLNNSRVENFSRQSKKILERLRLMKIVVATPIKKNKQFIVGSYPVVRFENYRRQELGEEGVELWTTFSPKIAVGFVASHDTPDCIALPDSEVRKLNKTLTKQSSAVASGSSELLRSLVKATW